MKTRTIKYISLEDIKAIAQQIGEQTGTKHIQEIHITISPVTPEGEAGPVKVEVIGLNID